LFLVVLVLRRIRVELTMLRESREMDRFYDRLESLFSLYRDLRFEKSLPALRHHAESPEFLREVVKELQQRKPAHVLELGGGVSTLVFARALQRNGKGHVTVVEHEPFYAQQLHKWLRDYQLEKWVTVVEAELTDYSIDNKKYRWYTMNDIPVQPFDVIVADGRIAKESRCGRYPTLPLLQNRLSEKSIVFVENVDDVNDREVLIRWSYDFPQYQQQPRAAGADCVVFERT
jgi:predicted O-methyltransferase YrrM